MLKIHKNQNAEDDLIDIWLYSLGEWGITQADDYLDDLNKAIKMLAANPEIGTACDYVREGYKKWPVKEHYIFYKVTLDTLSVIRVLGDSMDYQPILQGDSSEHN